MAQDNAGGGVRVSLAKGPRLTGAYTARDKFDDQLFRNARLKIPEIEMRLVRSGRNVPMAERLLALPPGNPREARHAPKPLLENGNLQLLTPPGFSVPLPGVVGLVPLSVSAPDQMRSRYRAPGFDAGVGQTREITQAIVTEITDYSKRSFENGIKTMESLLGVKSLDKAIEVQSE